MIGCVAPFLCSEATGLASILLQNCVHLETSDEFVVIVSGEVDPVLICTVCTIGIDFLELVTLFSSFITE